MSRERDSGTIDHIFCGINAYRNLWGWGLSKSFRRFFLTLLRACVSVDTRMRFLFLYSGFYFFLFFVIYK